ncbi:RHS repeat-associated core domain-containing protein [Pseudomonas soli]|uniref:RHS repeat-associated core domain-containing protein n=1 Tax=Pseudomonas soli TaxID=1306993 RepID=UPI0037F30900
MNNKHVPYTKDSIFALGSPPPARRYALTQSKLLATDLSKSILLSAQGAVQQNNAYSPYGDLPPGCARNLLAYNGEYLEQAGFYMAGHGNRVYSYRLMRFLSPDRTGVFLQRNYNAYAYCNGDPINYSDPSGNVGKLKQLAYKALISHGDNPIAAAETTRQRLDTRTAITMELFEEFVSATETSIWTQYQDKKIDTETAGRSPEGREAHKKNFSLSPEEIKKHTKTAELQASNIERVHRAITEQLPMLEMEAIVYVDAMHTVLATVNAIRSHYKTLADENGRVRSLG